MQIQDSEIMARASKIKLLLLDVDGVMSDGKIYFSSTGSEIKSFNTLDGHGIKMLRRSGVEVGIITGRTSEIVASRAKDLGIHLLKQGREDKFDALRELQEDFPCAYEDIAYVGDDYPDLTVMIRAGLSISVANAHPEVAKRSHWQTTKKGGDGAVREVCDMIMLAQGTFDSALEVYLSD